MSAARILVAYRAIFCALIVVASIQTLADRPPHHGVLLAVVEIPAALMLLWRRTQWLGAAALLVVFAAAQVLSALQAEYPTRFVQYAASTLLIVLLDRRLSGARQTDADKALHAQRRRALRVIRTPPASAAARRTFLLPDGALHGSHLPGHAPAPATLPSAQQAEAK